MKMPHGDAHAGAASTLQGPAPCPGHPPEPPVYHSLWTVVLTGAIAMVLLSARRRRRWQAGMVGEDAIGSCVFVVFMLAMLGSVCVLPTMVGTPRLETRSVHEAAWPLRDSVAACRCAMGDGPSVHRAGFLDGQR